MISSNIIQHAVRDMLIVFSVAGLTSCTHQSEPPTYTPGLGEIMSLNQMRHAKLWFAGENANWPLAQYELDELQEGLADAAAFHPIHKDAELPIPAMITMLMSPPIKRLEAVVQAHDREHFAAAFDSLTAGCNGCHQATKFGFNIVVRPTVNPYTNQDFKPEH